MKLGPVRDRVLFEERTKELFIMKMREFEDKAEDS
jgi:hypothetical protein